MKKFEFKSQICTTKAQSEKLLALGLKKETADMWYPHFASTYPIPLTEDEDITDRDIPAWSLHRLTEILELCPYEIYPRDNVYKNIIDDIEEAIKDGLFNTDYLEDKL